MPYNGQTPVTRERRWRWHRCVRQRFLHLLEDVQPALALQELHEALLLMGAYTAQAPEAVTILAARESRPVVSRSKAARGRVFQVVMLQRYRPAPTGSGSAAISSTASSANLLRLRPSLGARCG